MKNMKSKLIGIMLKISAFIVLLILAGIILYVLFWVSHRSSSHFSSGNTTVKTYP